MKAPAITATIDVARDPRDPFRGWRVLFHSTDLAATIAEHRAGELLSDVDCLALVRLALGRGVDVRFVSAPTTLQRPRP